jgi:hypothetical protein
MKTLLGCLMCLVFTMSQSFAISGGPFGGGAGKPSTTGTYAGVMFAASHVPCDTCTGQASLNQLALFSTTVPKSGLGTGTVLLFNQGNIYNGTISASADPDSAKLTGIVSASFSYVELVETGQDSNTHAPIFTAVTVAAVAAGKVDAKVKNKKGSTSVRLTGTADVQFELTVNNPFDEVIFNVVGFKQSNS